MNVKSEELVRLLTAKGLRVTAAESCTGGLLCASIVDVPDASKVFDAGYVTYSNAVKIRLGVSEKTLSEYGAVSEQTAGEMAAAAAKAAGAGLAAGISGIAGPSGGSPEKPVGTVCFGIFCNGKLTTSTVLFGGLDRSGVRAAAVDHALGMLIEAAKKA